MHTFVLTHSPLVGPLTWSLVAAELRRRGFSAITPTLIDEGPGGRPYYEQHASCVFRALDALPTDNGVLLVAHSGAGMLLPNIGHLIRQPVASYIFVDSDIPQNGKSRLDMLEQDVSEVAQGLRQALMDGALLPTWTDEDLRDIIPDATLRRDTLAELHPRSLAFFEEPILVFDGWPDAPCGYLRFTQTGSYMSSVRRAQQERWAYVELDGGHFHMLVDPKAVADALLGLVERMGIATAIEPVVRGV